MSDVPVTPNVVLDLLTIHRLCESVGMVDFTQATAVQTVCFHISRQLGGDYPTLHILMNIQHQPQLWESLLEVLDRLDPCVEELLVRFLEAMKTRIEEDP